MTDILIREFEMPETCGQCPIFNFDYNICNILSTHHHEYETSRIYGCPLHELPEHGDLIDRDALIKTCNEIIDEDWNAKAAPYSWSYAYESFVDDIVAVPVIIPSNKEDDE